MASKQILKQLFAQWVAVATGAGLLAGQAAAQTSPAGNGPPQSTGQQLFGPPVGQQQQQELQQRRQQMQSSAPPPSPAGLPSSAGAPAPAGLGAPATTGPGSSGAIGEPQGATTPPAMFGNTLRNTNLQGQPTGAARTLATAPARLSLPEAVAIGLDNNLTTLLAAERAEEARALRQQVRSFLLPNLSGTAFQQNRTLNLAAQGLAPAGADMSGGGAGGTPPAASPIPAFIGPFNTFDARLNLSQALLNLAALREYKSSKAAVQVADLNAQLAREQVATFVALAYLTTQRSTLEVAAARADVALAENLRELAVKQRNAGVANGIDVVRAESRLTQERLRLVQTEANAEQTSLDLARAVGLPQGSAPVLTDTLGANPETAPPLETALPQALSARLDTRIAERTIEQRLLERRSRAAARYPVISAAGDYGQSASTPFQNDRATRTYGVLLSVPVFDGGYTRGRVNAALSQQRQAELALGNTRGQVEQDVRQALLGWRLATEQVRASDEQYRLAARELELATQRFRAGVADNTEVLRAQAGLANARALRVQARAQFGMARLNFAAATGVAQAFRL